MSMLAAYLHEQERRDAWEAYTAQMLWYLNSTEHARLGQKFEHPTWLDMMHPKEKDNRTGAEILEEVKAKIRARIKKQKGGE